MPSCVWLGQSWYDSCRGDQTGTRLAWGELWHDSCIFFFGTVLAGGELWHRSCRGYFGMRLAGGWYGPYDSKWDKYRGGNNLGYFFFTVPISLYI